MTSRVLDIRVKVDAEKGLVEFSRLGDQGSKALLRIQNAAQPAKSAFKALTAAGSEVRGQIEGMAARLGPLGSALSAIGPYGLVAGAALAGVTAALVAGIREIAEFEKAFFKVEAVLKATGNTTGLTSVQIKDLAQQIANTTLATEEQALGASAALASFGNVAGQNFERVLRIGQDLAATFGDDIQSQVVGLAKALEDPADNLRSLGDAAKYFTDAQKESIKTMVETGQQAQAVELILKTLEDRVGGTGEAEAKGLVGASDQLSKSWKDLLQVIADTGVWQSTLQWMTDFNRGLADILETTDDEKLVKLVEQRIAIEKLLSRNDLIYGVGDNARRRLAEIDAELQELNKKRTAQQQIEADAEQAAQAQAQRHADELKRQAELKKAAETGKKLEQDRKKIQQEAQKVIEASLTPLEQYNAELERLNKLKPYLTVEQFQRAVEKAGDTLEENRKKAVEVVEKAAKEIAARSPTIEQALAEPFSKAAQDIDKLFGDSFSRILTNGVDGFRDFGRQVYKIFADLAGQIAQTLVFRPILGSVVGSLVPGTANAASGSGVGLSDASNISSLFGGGNIASYINTFGANTFGTGFGSNFVGPLLPGQAGLTSTSLSGILGAAGIGSLVGGFLGKNQLGGSIGGGLGAGLGSVLAGSSALAGTSIATALGGFLLPGIGAVAGGLLGGLFGGKKPSNQVAGGFILPETGSVYQNLALSQPGVSTPKGTQNLDRFNQVVGQIQTYLTAIQSAVGGKFNIDSYLVNVGSRDPNVLRLNSGGQYGEKQIIADTDDKLINAAVSQITQTLVGAASEFSGIIAAAGSKTADELVKAIAKIAQRKEFDQSIQQQILELTNPLQAALDAEQKLADQRLNIAKELGADILKVEELNKLRREQVEKQYGQSQEEISRDAETIASRLRGIADNLRETVAGLNTSEYSPLTPDQRLQSAGQQFFSLASAARSGDVQAMEQLAAASQTYLREAQGFYASNEQYTAIFNTVRTTLDGLARQIDSTVGREQNFVDLTRPGGSFTTTITQQVGQPITSAFAELAGIARVANDNGGRMIELLDRNGTGLARDMANLINEVRNMRGEVTQIKIDIIEIRRIGALNNSGNGVNNRAA